MLYYFFAMLTAAMVVLLSNIRSQSNRWAAFFLAAASIGGLADPLETTGLSRLAAWAEGLNLTLTPYGVLLFSIVYSGLMAGRRQGRRRSSIGQNFKKSFREPSKPVTKRSSPIVTNELAEQGSVLHGEQAATRRIWRRTWQRHVPRQLSRTGMLQWLLLLPPALTVLVHPPAAGEEPRYMLLLLWSAPYYLASCSLLLYSFVRETDERRRRSRGITFILIAPTILAVLILINIARAMNPSFDFFKYVSLFIVYSLAAGLLFTFLYGVLGVKLRFESDPLESAMEAAGSGTALLNHTIKNEIGKIAISADNIRHELSTAHPEAMSHLDIIANSSEHMLAMVSRIHSQTREIVWTEEACTLSQIVDQSLTKHEQLLAARHITLSRGPMQEAVVLADPVHLLEAISNVIVNACEAMEGGGTLLISQILSSAGVTLSIADTGTGIPPAMMRKVLEPFYSTKNGKYNYGLGLSYVYKVMKKGGGSVELHMREGGGTSVELTWKRSRLVPHTPEEDKA
ncbi:sensor histidine kinase [Paenibacillus sp. GCM10023252]|uniref:sensor histidine kinase n=1 Tax=Paenibacillus sp. GCM10023252 TaxID=3252649 RepID=UPI00361B4AC4